MLARAISGLWHRLPHPPAVTFPIHPPRPLISYLAGMRSCIRNGCRDEAHVLVVFHYPSSTIWIDHLEEQREPNVYEFCATHWNRFQPPSGWSMDDRRRAEVLPFVHRLAG